MACRFWGVCDMTYIIWGVENAAPEDCRTTKATTTTVSIKQKTQCCWNLEYDEIPTMQRFIRIRNLQEFLGEKCDEEGLRFEEISSTSPLAYFLAILYVVMRRLGNMMIVFAFATLKQLWIYMYMYLQYLQLVLQLRLSRSSFLGHFLAESKSRPCEKFFLLLF